MDFDAADLALAQAASARARLGARPEPDEAAFALRALLADADPVARRVLKAAWGRLEVAQGGAISVSGATAFALAADRFGAEALTPADTPDAALKVAREGGRAVLDVGRGAWWGRLLAEPTLRIVAALPDAMSMPPIAVVVEARTGGPTGDDRTFWVTDSGQSPGVIIDHFSLNGLAAEFLMSLGGLKLFSLAGYVQAHDARLSAAPGRMSGVIGSAPVF